MWGAIGALGGGVFKPVIDAEDDEAPAPSVSGGGGWFGGLSSALSNVARGAAQDLQTLKLYVQGREAHEDAGDEALEEAEDREAAGPSAVPAAEEGALHEKMQREIDIDFEKVASSASAGLKGLFMAVSSAVHEVQSQVKTLPTIQAIEEAGRGGLITLGEVAGALRKAIGDLTISSPELFPGLDDEIVAGLERREANFPHLFIKVGQSNVETHSRKISRLSYAPRSTISSNPMKQMGGENAMIALEELANDSSRTVNAARGYLEPDAQQALIQLLGDLAPLFDLEAQGVVAAGEAAMTGAPRAVLDVLLARTAELEGVRAAAEARAAECVAEVRSLLPAPVPNTQASTAPAAGALASGTDGDAEITPVLDPTAQRSATERAASSSSAAAGDVTVRARGIRIGADVVLVQGLHRALKVHRLEALKALAEYAAVATQALLQVAREALTCAHTPPPHPDEMAPDSDLHAEVFGLARAVRSLALRASADVQEIAAAFVTALSQSMSEVQVLLIERAAAECGGEAEALADLAALKEGLFETVVMLSDQLVRDGEAAAETVSGGLRLLFSVVGHWAFDQQTKTISSRE